jgi:shikimate dehydrogenase
LTNRTMGKAEQTAAGLRDLPGGSVTSVVPFTTKALAEVMPRVDLIVNCTSLGMNPDDAEIVPHALLAPHHSVFDMVYKPLTPPLVVAARAAGAQAINGIPMLLWQGVYAFEWWFGCEAPVPVMQKALDAVLALREEKT